MDATSRYYLVLTAVFATLGALTSFALAWQLRDTSAKGPPPVWRLHRRRREAGGAAGFSIPAERPERGPPP